MCGVSRGGICAALHSWKFFQRQITPPSRSRHHPRFFSYPKLRNASMRSAVAGWVDKKPPPLSPDVRVSQVSAFYSRPISSNMIKIKRTKPMPPLG
jgi:hypothetical protein